MEKIFSVADYLRLVNDTLALIPSEQISIIGEVSDYRLSQGKWINFSLKDEQEEAKIDCFSTVYKQHLPLENGMKVQIVGFPKVYERFGKFSVSVERVELVGAGALQQAYEMMKKKLQAEGLFDPSRKRTLPRFPKRIGLITSREAAAYGDFIRILNNRWSGVEVLFTPVHVQGQHAVPQILEAFAAFNALQKAERPDVLVLTRGGGSLEDLHAFNDEAVARAVFQSVVPVVCGVGHERDESLCDFVADVRASTPSNAAERVVPDRREIEREIEMSAMRMEERLLRVVSDRKRAVTDAIDRMTRSFEHRILHLKTRVDALVRLFQAYDVQKTLNRGFAIVRSQGTILKTAAQVRINDEIQVQLAEGEHGARII